MNTKGEATKAEGMKLESVNDDDDDDDLVARMGQISLSDDYQQMLAVAKECLPHECLPEYLYKWPSEAKRVDAAQVAVAEMLEALNQDRAILRQEAAQAARARANRGGPVDSDDSDSEDDNDHRYLTGGGSDSNQHALLLDLEPSQKTFLLALPHCPFNLGFYVKGTQASANECCYCPCGPKLKGWRQKHCPHLSDSLCRTSKLKYAPHALMTHLKDLATPNNNGHVQKCIYHTMILYYMDALYQDFWGVGVNHKAMYYVGSKPYKEAEASEAREQQKILKKLQDDLVKVNARLQEQEEINKRFELALKISPDISSLKAKRDARDDFLEVCKVSREKVEPITEGDIEMYKIQYHDFLALWRYQHDVSRHEHQQKDIMFLAVPAKFDISSVFKTWFGNLSGNDPAYKKTDPTCLFKYWTKSEMKDIAGKFLVKWTVQFEAASSAATSSSAGPPMKRGKYSSHAVKPEEYVAVDEGGPSREFLSLLWKHLGSLVVDDKKKCFAERGEEKKVCRLFEPNGDLNYLVPQINDLLPKNTGTRTIMAYYRAVGRVILYCIGQEMPIAAHIIPDLYKCYLLKKLDPLNPKYPLIDLVDHVIAIFPIFNKDHNTETILETVDVYLEGLDDETDLKGEVDAETRFRKFAHHKFIKSRQKALEYIREGMTLNGLLDPSRCFAPMPLKAMDRLLFSRPLVDARDLIKTLIPRYDEVKGYSDSYRHQCQLLSVKKGQEATGIIVEMLENGTEEFCIDFLCFATGNLYLGSSDDKIFVEFNFSEMSPNSLPVAHTCVCTMKLPGQAYEGNRAVFEKKLLYCLKQIKVSRFDME